MYHLGQEAFLRAWTQMQDQDIFVMGEDLAWVDLVQENWDVPIYWCGFYREDHHIEFRQVPHIRDYLCEVKKKKWQVETDGEYIWAENQIQEAYQQRVNKLLKTLHEEAARPVGRGEKGTERGGRSAAMVPCPSVRTDWVRIIGPFYIGLQQAVAIL